MIVKLNKPQNTLQLIQINNDYVVIDLVAEIKEKNAIYSVLYGIGYIEKDYGGKDSEQNRPLTAKFLNSTIQSYHRNGIWQLGKYQDVSAHNCRKIIFASQSLNLEGVKLIEENDISEQLAEIKYPIKKRGSAWMPTSHDCNQANKQEGFNAGYKQAKENSSYTLEQLKEAIELAKEGNIGYYAPDCPNYYFDNSEQDIINSLNLLSVEIIFDENNQPLNCKLL